MPKRQTVVIIGAGPAGLTAAWELAHSENREDPGKSERVDYEIILLEESQEFGGISRTVVHNGNRMDIGGHRFFSKDDRIMQWWKRVLPLQGAPSYDDRKLGRTSPLEPGGPDPEIEKEVMLVRQRVSRIYWNGHFLDYPMTLSVRLFKTLGLKLTFQAGLSYVKSMFHKLPETNIENFYINRFGRKLYSIFFEGYTEKLWGRHPRNISADWGAQRVKSLSIMGVFKHALTQFMPSTLRKRSKVETSLIEEFWYPKLGPGQLWECVERECRQAGVEVITQAQVVGLGVKDGSIHQVTYERNHERHVLDADIVISSMPLKDLCRALEEGGLEERRKSSFEGSLEDKVEDILKENTGNNAGENAQQSVGVNLSGSVVPKHISAIAKGLPYRDFVTVGLLVKRLQLRNTTSIPTLGNPPIVPDCWIYVQDTGYKVGRIQIFNNWSPYLVCDVDDAVWIGLEYFCNEGDDFWNLTDEESIALAVDELKRMGLIRAEDDVLDSHRERVPKAYPAYFDTYKHMPELVKYLDSFGNLYCVGRNGQHRYNNQDHSMATAIEAVNNIRGGRKNKTNVWSVNTERQYHESKKSK